MYYICEAHRKAFQSYARFSGHWNLGHRGEPKPDRDDVSVEELPEGFTLIGTTTKEPPPSGVIKVPETLPEGFIERVDLSLNVQRFPSGVIEQIINTLKLHPEAHDNPSNFANLLLTILSSSAEGRRHQGKINLVVQEVFGQPLQVPPYVATPGAVQPFYNPYGYPPYSYQPGGFFFPPQQPGGQPVNPWGVAPENKEVTELRTIIESQGAQMARLENMLVEREEKKRAEEITQTFQSIRDSVTLLSTKVDQIAGLRDRQELEDKYERQLSELRARLDTQGRGIADSERETLQKQIAELTTKLDGLRDARIASLEHAVEEAKTHKGPVTGELDVIERLGEKILDEAGKARADVRTFFSSGKTAETFKPGRQSPEATKVQGEKIATAIEDAEKLRQAEDTFFHLGGK